MEKCCSSAKTTPPSACQTGCGDSECCGRKKCCRMMMAGLLVLGGFILALLVTAARLPTTQSFSQTTVIDAPASALYPQLVSLKNWDSWSPWADVDPKATVTFSGPTSGKDAMMAWEGNMQAGKGTITITEAKKDSYVRYDLVMEKPMKSTQTAEFRLDSVAPGKTRVTWSASADSSFFGNLVGLIMNCPKTMNTMFAKGLENLKAKAE